MQDWRVAVRPSYIQEARFLNVNIVFQSTTRYSKPSLSLKCPKILWVFLIFHMPATLHDHLIFLSFLSFFFLPSFISFFLSYTGLLLPTHYCCGGLLLPWSQSNTPHSVGLLWTKDLPVAEPSLSTWQHTTLTKERHQCLRRDSNPQTHSLDRAATEIGPFRFHHPKSTNPDIAPPFVHRYLW
jgi:hypothetical protein